jgi:hypothetical protein
MYKSLLFQLNKDLIEKAIKQFNENETYICPECGEEIEFDVYVEEYIIELKDL